MLSYPVALDLLNRYGDDAPWVRHCLAVSELAAHLSTIFAAKLDIDVEFVRSASLLHDIGRHKTHDPVLHGVEGYKLLMRLGYPREAFVCASHVFYGLEGAEASGYGLPECDFVPTTFEERLIPLVDFLVEHDRPTSLARRFESLRRRNSANADFLKRINRAEEESRALMVELDREFGISMELLAAAVLGKG